MEKLIAIPLAIIGFLLLLKSKKISLTLERVYTRQFEKKYGTRVNWRNPAMKLAYSFFPIMLGLALLALALHFLVGTIYIFSGTP